MPHKTDLETFLRNRRGLPFGRSRQEPTHVEDQKIFEVQAAWTHPGFDACWRAAGEHLNTQVQGGIQTWLTQSLGTPCPEQFSFRLGNQLFFVRLEAEGQTWDVPGSLESVSRVAQKANGHPCVMPMRHDRREGWVPSGSGWGLLHALTKRTINPIELLTDEPITMTDWELHDVAVQLLRYQLEERGHTLTSWQGSPEIDPSIWLDQDEGETCIAIRAARYPNTIAEEPDDLEAMGQHFARKGVTGYFASVAVESGAQISDQNEPVPIVPLLRGTGLNARVTRFFCFTNEHRQIATSTGGTDGGAGRRRRRGRQQ